MRSSPRLASLLTLGFALACDSIAAAKYDFGPWAAGTSPQEVGQRVADRFVASPHQNYGRPSPPKTVTYPEVCTWYGALTFADLSRNDSLKSQLTARFEPLFREEKTM